MIKVKCWSVLFVFFFECFLAFQSSVLADVRYETRIFVVDSGFPFKMHYPGGRERLADEIERAVRESVPLIAVQLGMERADTIRVYLTLSEDRYRSLLKGFIPEWSAGFSECKRQILGLNVMGISRTPHPLRTVVKHELSHLLLAQRTAYADLPVWFMEGLAMMQAGQWSFSRRLDFIRGYWKGEVPFLKDLDESFPRDKQKAELSYSLSLLAVEWLMKDDPRDLSTLTAFVRDKRDFEKGFRLTFGMSTWEFADRFHNYLQKRYGKLESFIQTIPYFSIITILLIIAYFVKKLRVRRKLREWEADEMSE